MGYPLILTVAKKQPESYNKIFQANAYIEKYLKKKY